MKLRLDKPEQETDDSPSINRTTQPNIWAFPSVPRGIRPQSSPANSEKNAFRRFRQEAVGDL